MINSSVKAIAIFPALLLIRTNSANELYVYVETYSDCEGRVILSLW